MSAARTIHLPPPHPASLESVALLHQCDITRGRSQGPGGQHRNKVETKVTIRHIPTGLEAHAGERRSQEQNRAVALLRLRLTLATHVRCPVPLGEIRTAVWLSRVSPSGRISCNPEHEEFPQLLAFSLDVLASANWDLTTAALRLACTPSQLLKLVKDHPPALAYLNAERARMNLHALR